MVWLMSPWSKPRIHWQPSFAAASALSKKKNADLFILLGPPADESVLELEGQVLNDTTVAILLGKFACVKVDTRSAAGKQLMKSYGIEMTPAVIVVRHRNGDTVSLSGSIDKESIRELLDAK